MNKKIILTASEEVTIVNTDKQKTVKARIDTGARLSSIDTELVAELGLGPVVRTKNVKSAHGKTLRPVINVNIILKGKKCNAEFTFIDRSHMSHPVLIGRNILEQGFVVDVNQK